MFTKKYLFIQKKKKKDFTMYPLVDLDLCIYARPASNLERSSCLFLPSAGIEDVCYHESILYDLL